MPKKFECKSGKTLTKAQIKENPHQIVELQFKKYYFDDEDSCEKFEKRTGIQVEPEDSEFEGFYYNSDLRSRFGTVTADPEVVRFDMSYFIKGMENRWSRVVDEADKIVEVCGPRVKDKTGKYKNWVH